MLNFYVNKNVSVYVGDFGSKEVNREKVFPIVFSQVKSFFEKINSQEHINMYLTENPTIFHIGVSSESVSITEDGLKERLKEIVKKFERIIYEEGIILTQLMNK